jgi:FkbM family methyltransferase
MSSTAVRNRQLLGKLLGDAAVLELRRYYQAYRLKRGHYDQCEAETALLKDWVFEGSVALDVGANIGVYTRLLSKLVGRAGAVYAFEPVPVTYHALSHNAARFEHANVVTYHAAVSDRCGIAEIVLPDRGFQSFYRAHLKSGDSESEAVIRVPQVALDSLLDILPRVDFIKCDVEGAEMLVLMGAEELLTTRHPKILLEVQNCPRGFAHKPQDVFDWLGMRGWHSYYLREGRLHSTGGIATDNPGPNYVFLKG